MKKSSHDLFEHSTFGCLKVQPSGSQIVSFVPVQQLSLGLPLRWETKAGIKDEGHWFFVFSLGTSMLSFELWVCCCFSNSGDSRDWMRRLKFLRRYPQISLDPLIPYEVAAAAAGGALLLPSRPSWQAPCAQFDKEDGFVADGANFQSTFLPASWHVKLVFDHRKTRKRVRKCRAIWGESSNKKKYCKQIGPHRIQFLWVLLSRSLRHQPSPPKRRPSRPKRRPSRPKHQLSRPKRLLSPKRQPPGQ